MLLESNKGLIFFTIAMMISGSVGLFVQLVDMSAMNIVFFRCVIGGLFLVFYVLLFDRANFSKVIDNLFYILACGLLLVFNWVCLFSSFKYTSISIAVSIYYLAPIFVMVYGLIFLGEGKRRIKLKIATILIAFIGASLASGIEGFSSAQQDVYGVLFALMAAFLYAGLVIVSKQVKEAEASHMALIQTIFGAIILLFFIDLSALSISGLRYDILILIGVVHTAVMYVLFFKGVKYSTIGAVALLGFIDPMIAVVLDAVVLGTHLSFLQWVGVALILSTILIKTYTDGHLPFMLKTSKE